MNNRLEVFVDDDRWNEKLGQPNVRAEQVFDAALAYLEEHVSDAGPGFDKPVVINLSLNNDTEVQKLNAEFRGMDKPTNVLSFANIDDESFWDELETSEEVELGDIVIALETLEKEAGQKGIPLRDHFAHLLVHGILHLFGYDHQNDAEADEMEALEVCILQQLNVNNPYEEL